MQYDNIMQVKQEIFNNKRVREKREKYIYLNTAARISKRTKYDSGP